MDMSNTMGSINDAQNAFFTTDSSQPLKWETHTGVANNAIEDSSPDLETLLAGLTNNLVESALQLIFSNGILERHFPGLEGGMLLQRDDALLDGAVDRLEIDECFIGLESQIV
jgi:hypothetical protein